MEQPPNPPTPTTTTVATHHDSILTVRHLKSMEKQVEHWAYHFITLFDEFGESTTCHGVNNVAKDNSYTTVYGSTNSKLRRGVWCVFFLISLIVVFVLTFGTAVPKLLARSTSTSYDSSVQSSLAPPAITICNYNTYPATQRFVYSFDDWTIKELQSYSVHQNLSTPKTAEAEENQNYPDHCNVDEVAFGFSGKDMRTCDEVGEWFDFLDPLRGLCSTFSFNRGLHISSAREFLELNFWEPPEDVQPTVTEAGMEVFIHAPGAYPSNDGIKIRPGITSTIVIDENQFRDYQPFANPACLDTTKDTFPFYGPYRKKTDHGADLRGVPTVKTPYSQENCAQMCSINLMAKLCNCVPGFVDVDILGILSQKKKSKPAVFSYTESTASDGGGGENEDGTESSAQYCNQLKGKCTSDGDTETKTQACRKRCKPTCSSTTYQTSETSVPYPHMYSKRVVNVAYEMCYHEFAEDMHVFWDTYSVRGVDSGARLLDTFPLLNGKTGRVAAPPACGLNTGNNNDGTPYLDPFEKQGKARRTLSAECANTTLDELSSYSLWLRALIANKDPAEVGEETTRQQAHLDHLLEMWREAYGEYDPIYKEFVMQDNLPSTLEGLYLSVCGTPFVEKDEGFWWPPNRKFLKRALARVQGDSYHIKIGFATTVVTKISKTDAYGTSDFLVDLGGYSGLFLGCTVLTGLEIGEFILLAVITALCPGCAEKGRHRQGGKGVGRRKEKVGRQGSRVGGVEMLSTVASEKYVTGATS